MLDSLDLFLIGIFFILVGLLSKITIFYYNKQNPAACEYNNLLQDKFRNKEELSSLEFVNVYISILMVATQKILLILGSILVVYNAAKILFVPNL